MNQQLHVCRLFQRLGQSLTDPHRLCVSSLASLKRYYVSHRRRCTTTTTTTMTMATMTTTTTTTTTMTMMPMPEAILFDCDGVLADTERDGHRVSFNLAFEAEGIREVWDEDRYGKLLEVGGGRRG